MLNLINGTSILEPGKLQAKNELSNSVIIHLLICLSYLSKERFSDSIKELSFMDRISQFVEVFSVK